MLNEILERLKVKLLNFNHKYGTYPKLIVLHPIYHEDEKYIYETISKYVPYIPKIDVVYSSRMVIEDFEVY